MRERRVNGRRLKNRLSVVRVFLKYLIANSDELRLRALQRLLDVYPFLYVVASPEMRRWQDSVGGVC